MTVSVIIDSEMRVLHPDARCRGFAKGTLEVARRKIYEHPEFALVIDKLSAEGQIDSMDNNGIRYGILGGLGWQDKSIQDANNLYVKQCVVEYPNRFRGLYIVNPKDPNGAAREIMELDPSIFIGVEIMNNYSGGHIDDPRLKPILDATSSRGLFLKTYAAHIIQSLDGDTAYRLLRFLRENPTLRVLAAHLGGLLCLYGLIPEIRDTIKNTYFITSVSSTMPMVKFAAEINVDNLLFGTDCPFNHCHDQATPLQYMKNVDMPLATRKKIMGNTARSLFNFD